MFARRLALLSLLVVLPTIASAQRGGGGGGRGGGRRGGSRAAQQGALGRRHLNGHGSVWPSRRNGK
jgi:hypothetical protein